MNDNFWIRANTMMIAALLSAAMMIGTVFGFVLGRHSNTHQIEAAAMILQTLPEIKDLCSAPVVAIDDDTEARAHRLGDLALQIAWEVDRDLSRSIEKAVESCQ